MGTVHQIDWSSTVQRAPEWLGALPIEALKEIIRGNSVRALEGIPEGIATIAAQQIDALRYKKERDLVALNEEELRTLIRQTH